MNCILWKPHVEKELANKPSILLKNKHQKNVKLVYLEVENHNEKAQKLYLANDFEIHNRKILKHKLS